MSVVIKLAACLTEADMKMYRIRGEKPAPADELERILCWAFSSLTRPIVTACR